MPHPTGRAIRYNLYTKAKILELHAQGMSVTDIYNTLIAEKYDRPFTMGGISTLTRIADGKRDRRGYE